jgi:hypothetical protein
MRESRLAGRRVNVISLAASICIMAAGLSCPSRTARLGPQPPRGDDEFVVFLTGSELGSLRPCGCSGGQLGGLQKRSAVFNRVPASRRLIVETGSLVESDREQDLIKSRIFFEAFKLLNYDVVRLTGQDHEIAARLGLLTEPPQPFHVMRTVETGQSPVFTRRIAVGDRDITVNIVSFDSPSSVLRPPPFALQPQDALTVDILILDYTDSKALLDGYPGELLLRSWKSSGSRSDEPQLLSKPGDEPLVFTVGRFGRYVCRLGVTIQEQTARPVVHFESIPLRAELPDDSALVQLHQQYQQLVAQSSLLESYPRIPLAEKLAFVGPESCRECHEPQYQQWIATGHAHALAALKKVGSDRDPECVICHVSGLEYEGGFLTEGKTPHLADVGCENCHGPGSEHVLTSGKTVTRRPRTACTQCHTPEQSGGFAGHEEEYMKKILHWREPAAAGNVKN